MSLDTELVYEDQVGIVRNVSRSDPCVDWLTERDMVDSVFLDLSNVVDRLKPGDYVVMTCQWQSDWSWWAARDVSLLDPSVGIIVGNKSNFVMDVYSKKRYRIPPNAFFSNGIKLSRNDKVSFYKGYSVYLSSIVDVAYGISIQGSGEVSQMSALGEKKTGVYINWRSSVSEEGTKFDNVFYHFQHPKETTFVQPGSTVKCKFTPFCTTNRRGQYNLTVLFGTFIAIAQGQVLSLPRKDKPGYIQVESIEEKLEFWDQNVYDHYKLQRGDAVECRYYGHKPTSEFFLFVSPRLEGRIIKNNSDTFDIITEKGEEFYIDEALFPVNGNIPLEEDDIVEFIIDQSRNPIDIMVISPVLGMPNEKYISVRDVKIPYKWEDNIPETETLEVTLNWQDPFLRVSSYKILSMESADDDFSSQESAANSASYDMNEYEYTGNQDDGYGYKNQESCPAKDLLLEFYPHYPHYVELIVEKLGVEKYEDFRLLSKEEWTKSSVKVIHRRRILLEAKRRSSTPSFINPNPWDPTNDYLIDQ